MNQLLRIIIILYLFDSQYYNDHLVVMSKSSVSSLLNIVIINISIINILIILTEGPRNSPSYRLHVSAHPRYLLAGEQGHNRAQERPSLIGENQSLSSVLIRSLFYCKHL